MNSPILMMLSKIPTSNAYSWLWYTLVLFQLRNLTDELEKNNNDLPCFDVFSMWADDDRNQTTPKDQMGWTNY